MTRIFVSGSSDGLGFHAARDMIGQGHRVIVHARSPVTAHALRDRLPGAEGVVVGDVSTIDGMRTVAGQVNAIGRCDAVIHNVALGTAEPRVVTTDGMTALFAVNVAAPYVLTALLTRPSRLVYLSSDMHAGGDASLDDLQWATRSWRASQAYSDTKLHDVMLALHVARCWPDVLANAVHPGWVKTRMGGRNAPDDIDTGIATQVWLAVSDDRAATVSGRYFHRRRAMACNPAATDVSRQQRLVDYLEQVTGVSLPA